MQNKELIREILAYAKDMQEYMINMRRNFHMYPELGFHETRTAHIIAEELKKCGLCVETGVAKTGIIANLPVCNATSTVAFRADMDALPINEENETEFKSRTEGVFHGCGHDANMAMLLGALKIMVSLKHMLKREVKCIFQPCEEQPPGGAISMIEQGALQNVKEIYGLHIDPNIPTGVFGLRARETMAASDRIVITISGEGGHSATPHLCVDPVVIAAEVIIAIQTIVSRKIDPLSPCVISLCQISGGSAFNVIPKNVKITGTVRTLDAGLRKEIPLMLEKIIKGITSCYKDASYNFEYHEGYPVLYNPENQVKFVQNRIEELFGDGAIKKIDAKLGGEDFSYYLKKANGAFVFLGSGNQARGTNKPLHSTGFLLDEEILYKGAALFAYIACCSWESY